MPPLNSRAVRQAVKQSNAIPGPKSLHRGIHYNQYEETARSYKANNDAKRQDPTELLVHHQKINAELQNIYARTAALDEANATMQERIEQSWKAFERIGGKRPKSVTGFADHQQKLSTDKKDSRHRAAEERACSGDFIDYRHGSALHEAKDKRIAEFQRRQLKRAHMLRRMGDPTPLHQSGKYDTQTGTLNVFNKTIRQVQREVKHDRTIREVKSRRGHSMWDLRGGNANINRPDRDIIRYTKEFELGGNGSRKRKRQ